MLKIVFRTDSSLKIGNGHVMRCLAMAEALKAQGAKCHFISRAHPGHLISVIRQRGFAITSLPETITDRTADNFVASAESFELGHTNWLGCDWETDAKQTRVILANLHPDWLVVDHYAIDQRWEIALKPFYKKLMVIDDLADRPHACDLLLDQNLGRKSDAYTQLTPSSCKVLSGSQFALLRPEFAVMRPYSLQRRHRPILKHLLISMGGVDSLNTTGKVLEVLKLCSMPQDLSINVVMGLNAPWQQDVSVKAKSMPWPTNVYVNVSDMAKQMTDSDLVIGAAGTTSWERCCLGVPSLMIVLADNQREIGESLARFGAAILLKNQSKDDLNLSLTKAIMDILSGKASLNNLSYAASNVTDGAGMSRVIAQMVSETSK